MIAVGRRADRLEALADECKLLASESAAIHLRPLRVLCPAPRRRRLLHDRLGRSQQQIEGG